MQLIGHLAQVHGFRRYLEFCTEFTGFMYAELDRSKFELHQRLMYYRRRQRDGDGLPIDFESATFEIDDCLNEIKRRQLGFDIILVDPWHEYGTSWRDLNVAFDLISEGGALVVHDCLPPRSGPVISPTYVEGEWCGVTYEAYLDFVLGRADLDYYTVDTDYGCGVIRKKGHAASSAPRVAGLSRSTEPQEQQSLIARWRSLGDDLEATFGFFEANRTALLRLISVDEFLRLETVDG
jgi:hypothetical protein